jgi:hypothetical protein
MKYIIVCRYNNTFVFVALATANKWKPNYHSVQVLILVFSTLEWHIPQWRNLWIIEAMCDFPLQWRCCMLNTYPPFSKVHLVYNKTWGFISIDFKCTSS